MKRKHGFLLFIAACIPGCGEMYQGYMKRGIYFDGFLRRLCPGGFSGDRRSGGSDDPAVAVLLF